MSRRDHAVSGMVPRELIAREKSLLQNEWLRQTIRLRFILVGIVWAMAFADFVFPFIEDRWPFLGASLAATIVNVVAAAVQRRSAERPWHFWALLLSDTLLIGCLVNLAGQLGYFGIPFFLVAAASYGLGLPRAARVQLASACVVYPIARILGLGGSSAPLVLVAMETLFLGAIGWIAIIGPIRYTYRVRRARRALGALEVGDFEVRLPLRALDDLGFLGLSFNATAEAMGTAVRALKTEVAERTRAEAALRDREQRLHDAERDATRMAGRMGAVADAAARVIAADSVTALCEVLHDACGRIVPLDDFVFALYDQRQDVLRAITRRLHDPIIELPVISTPYESVVREKRSQLIQRAPFSPASPVVNPAGAGDVETMCVPITASDRLLGLIAVHRNDAEAYTASDAEVLSALAALAATALRNITLVDELKSSREALSHQAYHDALTSLPNRRRFRTCVETALEKGVPERVTVLAVDLDGFKTVNDTLGHAAGDGVLIEVARRLLNATRGSDTVARLGGDEFAVLLEQTNDVREAIVVAERMIASMRVPISVGDRQVVVGVTVGIARADAIPEPTPFGTPRTRVGVTGETRVLLDPIDAVLRDADLAMYHAKTCGKGQWALFAPSMRHAAAERQAIEADLSSAIANGELNLHYQPIVTLDGGTLIGVEALLRWTHATRGVIPPSQFIPIAEASGLIIPLGEWVITTACAQAARWQKWQREHAIGTQPLMMSVNVSGRQLQGAGFVDAVCMTVVQSGLEPTTLILELTESAVMEQAELARVRLAALREAGFLIAIDDFGTGYSALSYLQDFPIDILKIDKAFIDGVTRGGTQGAFARTIVALADALSLRTIAEGIEHAEQRECLLAMGCELGQGYHFSRPVAPETIGRMLFEAKEKKRAVA